MKKLIPFLCCYWLLNAVPPQLNALKKAYPQHIKEITRQEFILYNGNRLPIPEEYFQDNYAPACDYRPGRPKGSPQKYDVNCARLEELFRYMYGDSSAEVQQHLTTVDWMPGIFGKGVYQLRVTTVHGVDKKLKKISDELEVLARIKPWLRPFLANPGGAYNWRPIANSNRLSNHSFGIAVDINAAHANYWQWDLSKEKKPIDNNAPLAYRNSVPLAIPLIFEKYGFIWGGKWYHYDTMHFEYRPELFL